MSSSLQQLVAPSVPSFRTRDLYSSRVYPTPPSYLIAHTSIYHRFSLAAAVAGYGVLQVFASFVAPLAWAVVTGAALYQLKSLLVNVVLSWLSTLAPTQKTVVFKNRDADVQGTHAEYERRMATKAAILSASTFVSDRRPLVLGLLLVPFALLDTVAVQAHELVVTCKQTRWRVLLTVGVLVALSHRPIALVLLVDTVTYLRSCHIPTTLSCPSHSDRIAVSRARWLICAVGT